MPKTFLRGFNFENSKICFQIERGRKQNSIKHKGQYYAQKFQNIVIYKFGILV